MRPPVLSDVIHPWRHQSQSQQWLAEVDTPMLSSKHGFILLTRVSENMFGVSFVMSEPKTTFTKEEFWSELDSLGEEEVRVRLSVTKQFGDVGPKHELAKIWLSDKDSSRRTAREEETLSIARDANRIASRAERWAMYAAIAAVIALIVAIANIQK